MLYKGAIIHCCVNYELICNQGGIISSKTTNNMTVDVSVNFFLRLVKHHHGLLRTPHTG